MPNFTDLQLRIFPRDGDAYPVELTVAGEQHTRGELAADVLPWAPGTDPATDGQRLFAALFAARDLYADWVAAQKSAAPRRVRLWLDAPELHVLPWELLHDGQTFLAAGGVTPFSRYVPTSVPWGQAEPARTFHTLVAIANPDDLDTYNLAPLDVETERSVIPEGADFLDPPVTLARLEDALRQGYTALHFVGHGFFSQKRQEAALYLEDAAGRTVPTPGADFAAMLTRLAQPPRLIFLAACQSATPATSRAYLGLGVELVTAGVPAVIAMRETIAIAAAQALSHTFYARLAENGQVDLALNEARSHLLTTRDPDAAIPALWMRLRSGRLWEEIEPATQGDGANALGERAVQAETVGGHVITGDGNVIHELPPAVLELFARQFGFDPAATDADALRAYFDRVIFERHSRLSFQFIRPETGKVYTETDVETVFVPLRMSDAPAPGRATRRRDRFGDQTPEELSRVVTLAEILRQHSCFLLRGKPGCGKTTLLRHIALTFARGEQQEKLGWEGAAPLPLLVPLRNFGQFLKRRAEDYVDPGPRALLEYLEESLRNAEVRFSPDFLRQRLEQGQCFLLLDALDEASGTMDGGGDLRTAVARQAAAFIKRYLPRGNRFALTSRPRAYQDDGVLRQVLPQPVVCDVLDLEPEGYRRLITNLLTVLTGDPAAGAQEADDLAARIAPNRHLTDLAGNPLLCTTLVLVYKYRGRKLPERRVDVLHEVVTLLLGRWEEERRYVDGADALARLGTTAQTTEQAIRFRRRALTALAWQMQTAALPELTATDAIATLAQFYCAEERADETTAHHWARQFLTIAHERSGLFIELDEGRHTFAHQAFREYLAATHLVNAGETALLDAVLSRAPAPDEWWEQTLLLAGAHPEQSEWAAQRLVAALLEHNDTQHAYLAARFAQDMTDKLPGAQRKLLQDRLLGIMRDPQRPAKERALAGRALALAGDPRPGVGLLSLPLSTGEGPGMGVPDILWVEIPAGPFWMGEGKELHQVMLPTFYIARYPVTRAQFAAFTHAGGYAELRYWPEAAQAGVWAEGKVEGQYDKAPRVGPQPLGEPFSLSNHPVVGVTWYEALAFCRWLEEQLKVAGCKLQVWRNGQIVSEALPPTSCVVRLPSEAEWEKAARGGIELPDPQNPKSKRRYPWGDDPDPERANYDETGIKATNAVGAFPGGASVYGVEELSGNVWEWTRSGYRDYPYKAGDGREDPPSDRDDTRVLRGGAFDFDGDLVRCAFRLLNLPDLRFDFYGFRIVVGSPFSPTLDADPSDR